MKTLHAQPVPARQLSNALSIKYVRPCIGVALGKFDALLELARELYLLPCC